MLQMQPEFNSTIACHRLHLLVFGNVFDPGHDNAAIVEEDLLREQC